MSSPILRYQKLILPLGLWLFSLILLSVQSYKQGRIRPSPFSRSIAEIVSLPQRSYGYLKRGTIRFWQDYVYLVGIRRQNLELQKQLALLEMENQMLLAQVRETERLKALLNFQDSLAFKTIPARIIGWDLSSYAQTITINKGSKSGIAPDQPVICFQGLVGKIVDEPGRVLSSHNATVLLITDPTSRVSVVVERTRDRGILQGTGRLEKMLLVYLSSDAKLEPGDQVSTSGLGGIFPPGMKTGAILNTEMNPFFGSPQAWVGPSVDFKHLEEVLVVVGQEKKIVREKAAAKEPDKNVQKKN